MTGTFKAVAGVTYYHNISGNSIGSLIAYKGVPGVDELYFYAGNYYRSLCTSVVGELWFVKLKVVYGILGGASFVDASPAHQIERAVVDRATSEHFNPKQSAKTTEKENMPTQFKADKLRSYTAIGKWPPIQVWHDAPATTNRLYFMDGSYYLYLHRGLINLHNGVFLKLNPDVYGDVPYFHTSGSVPFEFNIQTIATATRAHFEPLPELKRYAAMVMCVHPVSGQILGTTRRNKPDDWGFVGGTNNPGETTAMTASREFHEETGIRLSRPPTFVGRFPGEDDGWECDMYLASKEDELEMAKHFTSVPREVEQGIMVGYVDYAKMLSGSFGAFQAKFLNTYLANAVFTLRG